MGAERLKLPIWLPSAFFFLSETFVFLLTYVVTPLTVVLSLLLSDFFFWTVRHLCPSSLPLARSLVCGHWKIFSKLWHGHEIHGRENIPSAGPALLLFYHGALPVDYYFLVADTYLYRGRLVQSVADKFLFKLPGFRSIMWAFQCQTGTRESLVSVLRGGHLLGLSPGGTYEAQMGDNMYKVMWKGRAGFAKVLADMGGGVPVIPVFTQNIREAYKSFNHGFTHSFWVWLHDTWKIRGFVPVYGGFPVKLRTFIGSAITLPEGADVEEIRSICLEALESLVNQKQVLIPGSTWRALAQRVL